MKVNRGRWCRSWAYRGRPRSVLDDAVAALYCCTRDRACGRAGGNAPCAARPSPAAS